jgi:hypothetical protein
MKPGCDSDFSAGERRFVGRSDAPAGEAGGLERMGCVRAVFPAEGGVSGLGNGSNRRTDNRMRFECAGSLGTGNESVAQRVPRW